MCRSFSLSTVLIQTGTILLVLFAPPPTRAEWSGDKGDQRKPVYQRRAFEWMGKHGDRFDRRHGHAPHWAAPPVSAGWFQRPYPYHLDYYRMRYGGSYAPYFGNLYGPPQVVTAPPYYGPYYGGYGAEAAAPNGGWGYAGYPNGVMYGPPVEAAPPTEQPLAPNGDASPPPQ